MKKGDFTVGNLSVKKIINLRIYKSILNEVIEVFIINQLKTNLQGSSQI